MERDKLQTQKEAIAASTEEYKLVAQTSDIVHLNGAVTKGMVLQGGSSIGTITSNQGELIVETLIPSSERPRIHEEDEVSLAVGGLNQAEYGTLKGTVVSIDEDATIDSEEGNVYFKVKVKPEKTYLQDKKGEKVNLTLGMVTETRVKYEKIMSTIVLQLPMNYVEIETDEMEYVDGGSSIFSVTFETSFLAQVSLVGAAGATAFYLDKKGVTGAGRNVIYSGLSALLAGLILRNMLPKTSFTRNIIITNPTAHFAMWALSGFDHSLTIGIY